MKKKLLLLSLVSFTITVTGQNSIPNGSFEIWNSSTYEYPQNYPFTSNLDALSRNLSFNEVKTTDAFHGQSAVMLSSFTKTIGYFVNTNPNNGQPDSWTGGMPYDQMPAGIRGYYKYNVATADSGLLIVSFRKAGIEIGTYYLKVGGIQNTYSLFNFTFNPALTQIPDSVIFGAVSSDITISENGVPGSVLFIDSVSFTGVTSQPALLNGDFESWQESQTPYTPADWYNQDNKGNGMNRTTDIHIGSGQYAIELKTYSQKDDEGNTHVQSAQVSTGYYDNVCHCMRGGFPFSNQIDTLVFYYKYIPSGSDNANVFLEFKKDGNFIMNNGWPLPVSSSYQYVEFPFNTGQTPDSVIVQLSSSNGNDLSYIGSDLKIDDVHFKSQQLITGIVKDLNDNLFSLSPNPSNGKFKIQGVANISQVKVYDLIGKNIHTIDYFIQQLSPEVDLSDFQRGIYFVRIKAGAKNYVEKIVLQ